MITSKGEAYVDLSPEVQKNHPGGTTSETLTVYALVNSVTGPLSFRPLYEGAGGYWQAWITLSGYLNDASIAAANGHFYVVGRNATNDVWWYESGDLGWVQYGLRGLVGDKVSVAPR